jgi:hypothetical protein
MPILRLFPPAPRACTRLAALAAGVLLCLVVLGCMSISFGGKNICCPDPPEPFEQKGEVCLSGQGDDVYYPIAYASPPNLTVNSSLGSATVVEQKPDHFRVCGTGKVKWVARGVRVGPTVVIPGPPTPPPPALLPGPPLTPAPTPPPPEPKP